MDVSKTLEQIFKVIELLKEDIIKDLLEGKQVTTDGAEDRVKYIFEDAGRKLNVDPATIRNKCTEQLGLSASEFYNLTVRYITRQDEELEEIIVDNRKETIDSATQTRVLLQKIRDK